MTKFQKKKEKINFEFFLKFLQKTPPSSPDSKTQVTIQHEIKDGEVIPKRVHTIVISVQHDDGISNEVMRKVLKEDVIAEVVPEKYLDENTIGVWFFGLCRSN